jgi:CDP-paratose 2-epimerase
MLEAIRMCEEISGKELDWEYVDSSRMGDHIWWISDISRFQSHYPGYKLTYGVKQVLAEIFESNRSRWTKPLIAHA